jgi:primosomal protein N'
MKPILFIHPRRGLFQLTSCQSCHYKFGCDNCDCNLTTYRTFESNMQLLCHQCQSYYTYPKTCPMCHNTDIGSNFGGVDELVEVLKKDFGKDVIKVESKGLIDYAQDVVYVTTRIFDPSLEYNKFGKIVFIHAENLMASPDYLVNEDVHRSLAELLLQIDQETEVIFDTNNPDLPFFVEMAKLNSNLQESQTYSESFDLDFEIGHNTLFQRYENNVTATTVSPQESETTTDTRHCKINQESVSLSDSKLNSKPIHKTTNRSFLRQDDKTEDDKTFKTTQNIATPNVITWYTDFVQEESRNRQKFKFPPFDNLILLTTQEKSKEKSIQKINSARQYLFGYKNELQLITIGSPYQAKFLKRKGMFSHHLLVKFPRQYSQYFQLRDIVKSVASTYNLQARLNPRHLF